MLIVIPAKPKIAERIAPSRPDECLSSQTPTYVYIHSSKI